MKLIILLIFLFSMSNISCAGVAPKSTILIFPVDNDGIKRVEITQTRLGKTELTDDKFTVSYDSKGTSIIQDITKEIMPIIMLEAIKD